MSTVNTIQNNTNQPNKQRFNKITKLEQDLKNLQKRIHSPKVDLVERDNVYSIRIELPGVDLDSIKIEIKNSQIVLISGSKTKDTVYENDKVVYRESKYDSFTRRVKLPGLINYDISNQLFHNFQNGVLYLTFEKQHNTQTQINNSEPINFENYNNNNSWSDDV